MKLNPILNRNDLRKKKMKDDQKDQNSVNESQTSHFPRSGSLKTDSLKAAPSCEHCSPVFISVACPLHSAAPALYDAAKAALEYVDNMNEDTPVDPNCKECVGRVFFAKGTPEPPLCWIHQLEKAVDK